MRVVPTPQCQGVVSFSRVLCLSLLAPSRWREKLFSKATEGWHLLEGMVSMLKRHWNLPRLSLPSPPCSGQGRCSPLSSTRMLECPAHFAGPVPSSGPGRRVRGADLDLESRDMMSIAEPLRPQEYKDMHSNPKFSETLC